MNFIINFIIYCYALIKSHIRHSYITVIQCGDIGVYSDGIIVVASGRKPCVVCLHKNRGSVYGLDTWVGCTN